MHITLIFLQTLLISNTHLMVIGFTLIEKVPLSISFWFTDATRVKLSYN